MPDDPSSTRVSDDAVRAATGFGWDDWFTRLDAVGAASWSHPRIVRWLRDDAGLENGWWQQNVTVEYEKARGMRAPVGQDADGAFQVGLQRTVDLPAETLWERLLTRPARDAWLGPTDGFEAAEGAAYATDDGVRGEVRRVRPGERVRLTWRPADWSEHARVQLTVTPRGDRATVGFHAERLPDASARDALRERWREALARVQEDDEGA